MADFAGALMRAADRGMRAYVARILTFMWKLRIAERL